MSTSLVILLLVMVERLRAMDSISGVWSAECGFESRSWHLLHKIGEVVLSALPARLRTDDTQAYIRIDCKRGNPVSALGVGGNSLWKKKIVAHTLKWPSGLVCLAMCIQKQKQKQNMYDPFYVFQKCLYCTCTTLYKHDSMKGQYHSRKTINYDMYQGITKIHFVGWERLVILC